MTEIQQLEQEVDLLKEELEMAKTQNAFYAQVINDIALCILRLDTTNQEQYYES